MDRRGWTFILCRRERVRQRHVPVRAPLHPCPPRGRLHRVVRRTLSPPRRPPLLRCRRRPSSSRRTMWRRRAAVAVVRWHCYPSPLPCRERVGGEEEEEAHFPHAPRPRRLCFRRTILPPESTGDWSRCNGFKPLFHYCNPWSCLSGIIPSKRRCKKRNTGCGGTAQVTHHGMKNDNTKRSTEKRRIRGGGGGEIDEGSERVVPRTRSIFPLWGKKRRTTTGCPPPPPPPPARANPCDIPRTTTAVPSTTPVRPTPFSGMTPHAAVGGPLLPPHRTPRLQVLCIRPRRLWKRAPRAASHPSMREKKWDAAVTHPPTPCLPGRVGEVAVGRVLGIAV